MRISVVVPAFNEERLLPRTLESIRLALTAFERRGWSCELIVCDNNSTDRTAELACKAGAKVVFEPVNQISRARNAGAAQRRPSSLEWRVNASRVFLVVGRVAGEHLRLVAALRLEVQDQDDVADEHDARKDRHIGQGALLGGIGGAGDRIDANRPVISSVTIQKSTWLADMTKP